MTHVSGTSSPVSRLANMKHPCKTGPAVTHIGWDGTGAHLPVDDRGQPGRRAFPEHHVGQLVVAVHQAGDVVDRPVRPQPGGGDVEAGQLAALDAVQEGGPPADLALVEAVAGPGRRGAREQPGPGADGAPVDPLCRALGDCAAAGQLGFSGLTCKDDADKPYSFPAYGSCCRVVESNSHQEEPEYETPRRDRERPTEQQAARGRAPQGHRARWPRRLGALRDWASLELNGYAGSDEQIPPYRGVPALIKLDGLSGFHQIKGQTIAPTDLPDFVREHIKEYVELPFGVGELEAIVRDHNADEPVRLSLPLAADLARLLNSGRSQYQQITALYWAVSPSSVRGVLDRIRTKLAELVGELSATMLATQETPSAEQATQAIHFVQTGRRSTIKFANAQSTTGGTSTVTQGSDPGADPEPAWWTLGRKIGAFIVGCAIIAGAVFAYLALHH